MGVEYELGAQRKRRMVATYGKAGRRRLPNTIFTPATASESLSEEDPITASDKTVANYRPQSVSPPKPESPPVRFDSVERNRNTQTRPTPFQNIANSDRKRKASQVYKPRERLQPVTDESEGGNLSSAPQVRRSRITEPEIGLAAKSSGRSGGRERTGTQQRAPSDPMDIEAVEPRLSSPPPTPTPPRVSKLTAKPSSHVLGQKKSTNAPSGKSAQKQPVQRQQQIPLHLARKSAPKPKQSNALSTSTLKEQSQRLPVDKPLGPSLAKKSRKRLIDALVEQESSDDIALGEGAVDAQVTSSQTMLSQSSNASDLDSQSLLETPKPKTRTAPATGTRTFARSNSALKFTYGQGRKVREEEDNLLESLVLPEESSYSRRRLDLSGPKKSIPATGTFDFDDDDGTTGKSPSSKLRGIHELRQAGANSRVADAMQDLVDQIGEPGTGPSSSRRAALLQVAEKLRDKTFIRQCRDHGVESVMLKRIGEEADTICGYLILSSLVAFIVRGPPAHLGQLLRTEEAGPIFARLLSMGEDIKKVAKDRKSNLSKRSQNSIVAIENLLRELPIWDGDEPSFISPRSLAIKCLQLLIAQGVLIGGDPTIFTEAVTKHLFEVLSDANNNPEYWDYPKTARSIELCGALSVLDANAVSIAVTQDGNSEWAIQYLPIVADVFYTSLQTPAPDAKILEDLILKLTINVTNNNIAAPNVFASKGLLLALASSISSNFNQALTLIAQGTWAEGIIDSLVLRLGILINFAEHSGPVRQMVDECRQESREPVQELIRLFIENHHRTGEADSMEKTRLNVAFGYLSVLLGYLSLHGPVRHKLIHSHSAKSIGPLVGSIREFIAHYEQVENEPVENAMSESDEGDRHYGTYAARLQELVQQLEEKAAYD
ncbi:wings apart-like protein regulation of heterochromatin-domain-containing protein [Xylaria castorea]|nr:wings apart-like protein regulation of heterochromatin-domain-containing protein [Xylaria castorea]